MHVNSPLREYHSKEAERELAVVVASTSMGGFHADPDLFGCGCCCSNAGVGACDTACPGGALSDSFLRLRWNIRRVWQRTLLARRADRSSSYLAIRRLSGQRSGSIHSWSNHARSNKRCTSLSWLCSGPRPLPRLKRWPAVGEGQRQGYEPPARPCALRVRAGPLDEVAEGGPSVLILRPLAAHSRLQGC
jgi:hypothetical protein